MDKGLAGLDGASSSPLALMGQEEMVKVELSKVKKMEAELKEEKVLLEQRKHVHIRELKRVRDEDKSRFANRPVLANRYVMTRLLGKGGFSEVWKAFDLDEYRFVAVKVHQLNPQWNEAKKQNYTKHATREFDIQRGLSHPHVVGLLDVFEIDLNSFATVLENCEGPDLDIHLKKQKILAEREARCIIIQVLHALHYLNNPCPKEGASRRQRIIHYDLKPGNIIFDGANHVKITDFGLSKIMYCDDQREGDVTGMELTSQGAGTYWYLPPECFQVGPQPPKISSKVDVWSVGIILFQMLYGRRPFGEGLTQDKILSSGSILNAGPLELDAKSGSNNISVEARAFIQVKNRGGGAR